VEERARLATLEAAKMIRQLEITETFRFSVLYTSLVESQLYGIELFPASGAPVINRVRRVFLAALFELPADMSSLVATFLMRLVPSEILILKRRWNFEKRLRTHAIPSVHQVIELESHLGKRNTGWHHESFMVAKSINPALRLSEFSIEDFSIQLFENFPDLDKLNFVLIQKRAQEDEALSFFCYLDDYRQASRFRKSLGTISFDQARLVLLFLFSGLRWRISRMPLKTCPFCPRFALIWRHFFECETIAPYLAADFLSLELLLRYARTGKWRDAFTVIGDVIRVWGEFLSTCSLDLDVVNSLCNLP
jgi:hypothetical protein